MSSCKDLPGCRFRIKTRKILMHRILSRNGMISKRIKDQNENVDTLTEHISWLIHHPDSVWRHQPDGAGGEHGLY